MHFLNATSGLDLGLTVYGRSYYKLISFTFDAELSNLNFLFGAKRIQIISWHLLSTVDISIKVAEIINGYGSFLDADLWLLKVTYQVNSNKMSI